MITKAPLRQQFLEKRLTMNAQDIQVANEEIFNVVKSILRKTEPNVIHFYLPHPAKNEVDTWKMIHWVWENLPDTDVVAPYIVPGTKDLQHFRITPQTKLYPNAWQIPEPDPETSERVHIEDIEIVFIPLLAFDKKGFRVGYGGGYYDRFLEQCPSDVLKVGLSFFEPVDEIDDLREFDVALNMCITPEYIYRF
ncbi:5-formyltetrahydrofolate cyclo-ligase [Dyadobacter luticola]|uniref:5-formyltetrahydrofolate cyclo-ligase n=1 Tax=Dyadobacter luticola TaxID=1979387 RepID=A0A5R9KNL9_9BACT|nr:5-formyltetrahydrofolate cyclo-ligase [Dyadobacter luticola]TLU97872.1 5-formyltetrahydrofolate cyclo-ligase [Dyadobacter luticola]